MTKTQSIHRVSGPLAFLAALSLQFGTPATASEIAGAPVNLFVSEHRIQAAGKTIAYTATAGDTILKSNAGEPVAAIWSVAYVAGEGKDSGRPVVFVFGGGPGAAAGGMQMGMLGPRIVRIPGAPDADDGAAPFLLIDNPDSLLDIADLVFVDPVGTGYSRAIGNASDADFWSMQADTASMADFMHRWITVNQRWNSPKYILGLSYGSTRATSLAYRLLLPPHHMALNGLMLHGPALDFIALDPIVGNPLSHVSFLPTMAAIAHYHGKAGTDVDFDEFLARARQFATTEYFAALMGGTAMKDAKLRSVAEKMSSFMGLDADFMLNERLRVSVARFRTELLRADGLIVGYSDGRFTSKAADPNASVPVEGDPSTFRQDDAYGAAINIHLGTDLGVRMDRSYYLWNPAVGRDWTWGPDLSTIASAQAYRQAKRTGRIEVASQLAAVMRQNPEMKVQLGVGYFDLYTPFMDTERVCANFGIDRDRVETNYYSSGHRIWVNETTRGELAADMRRFLTSVLAAPVGTIASGRGTQTPQ